MPFHANAETDFTSCHFTRGVGRLKSENLWSPDIRPALSTRDTRSMFASCCTATSSVPARDPADKTLDLIKYRALGVPAVDDVLDPAFDMLNTAIRLNNTLVQTVDTLKLVGSTLMGAFEPAVDINDATVTLLILTQDAKGNRLPVAEIKGADMAEVKKPEDYKRVAAGGTALIAIEDAASALSKLNDGLKEGGFTVAAEGGRLTLKASEDVTVKQVTEYTNTVTGFNNTYFKVRLQLVQMALADGLKQAVREMIANVKALLKGAFKPSLSVDFSKLMEGELDIKPELGLSTKELKNLAKMIPAKVKACLDALFGELPHGRQPARQGRAHRDTDRDRQGVRGADGQVHRDQRQHHRPRVQPEHHHHAGQGRRPRARCLR